MPGGFKYPSSSDIDPNVVDLLYRAIKPKLDSLIDDRQQRRQVWGPTFKQEGIRILPIGDADYVIPAPEYGKRTLIFTGPLTAERRVELPSLSGAWWIIRNDTAGAIKLVAGAEGVTGPVVPIGESAAVYTDGHVVWTFPTIAVGGGGGGTGALPDGVDTELQARAGPTTFKRVTYSITSDQHVSLAGAFTVTLPVPNNTNNRIVIQCTDFNPRMEFLNYRDTPDPIFIFLNKARGTSALPAVLLTDDWVGAIRFQGWTGAPAAWNTIGYLDVRWIEPQGAVTNLGAGAHGRANVGISDNGTIASAGLYAAAIPTGSHYYQVQSYGHLISGGQTGSIWYQDAPTGGSYYIALNINPATDNGKVLTVVETGPSTGVYLPRWMPPAGGAGGGAPGLPDWSLQFRQNATTFGGVTSSIVTGANIVLGGELAFHNVASTDQHIRVSALGSDPVILMAKFGLPPGGPLIFIRRGRGTHALPEPLGAGDYIGAMLFQGYDGADWTTHGYWRSGLDSVGSVTELGAGPFDQALVRITHNPLSASAAIVAGTGEWRVQTDGLITSFGLTGSLFYKAPGGPPAPPSVGYVWDLPIGLEGQILTVVESTHPTFGDYLHPAWTTAAAAGGVPDGDFHELQSRWDATTFKRVLNSEVTGADIKLAGNLTISDVVGHTLFFEQTAPVGSAQQVGVIWFREYLAGGAETIYGYVRAYREDVWVVGTKVVEMGLTASRRVYISDIAASLDFDGYFFHARSDGLRISGGVQGAFFYQEGAPPTGPIYTPLAIGAANTYLRSDGARPQWAVLPAGTVTSPGGAATQIQFNNAGAFGGIAGSAVDTNNVWLTGFLNVNQSVCLNEAPGFVTFRGDAGATVYGYVHGYGSAGAGVVDIGIGNADPSPTRLRVEQVGAILMLAGTYYIQVQNAGIDISLGANGGIYYKNGFLQSLDIGAANTYLKSNGTVPGWAALTWTDITGVLPISKGGTGTGTPPTSGQLLIGKLDGTYNLHTLTPDTGIQITNGDDGTITIKCTISPGAGATPPGGSATQIQFHNTDDTFAGISGSSVSGANIGLGGNITVTSTGERELLFNRTTSATGILGALLGQVAFKDSTTAAAKALIRTYWTNAYSAGYTFEMWMADDRRLYISEVAATMEFVGQYITLQSAGVGISVGTAGGELYYRGSTGFITVVPITSATNKWLRFNGSTPTWQTISAGSNVTISEVGGGIQISASGGTGGGTPGSPNLSLQYNNGGAFAGIDGVKVVTAGSPNLMFGGYLQMVASWTQATSTSDIDQEFFISARKSTFEGAILPARFTMRTFRDDNTPPYILLERGRGTATSIGNVAHSDIVGELRFGGHRGLTNIDGSRKPTVLGSVISWWDSGVGGVIRMGAMNGGGRVECSDNGSLAAATMFAYSSFFQVQNGGFRISIGNVGAIYYQSHTGSQTQLVELNSSTGANGYVLTLIPGFATENGFLVPRWQPAPTGGGGGTPGGSQYSTQYNTGSGFGGTGPGSTGQYLRSTGSGVPTYQFLSTGDLISGVLPIARGGTGTSGTPSSGQLLIGNGSGYSLATLTPGANITITNSAGGITIAAASGGGGGGFTTGTKTLTDNTRVAIFRVAFGTFDHKAVAGLVHFTIVAKQVSGGAQISAARRSAAFIAVHWASSAGYGRWGSTVIGNEGIDSGPALGLSFDCNGVTPPGFASNANTYDFYLNANSDMSSWSQFEIWYNIEYNSNDVTITLL